MLQLLSTGNSFKTKFAICIFVPFYTLRTKGTVILWHRTEVETQDEYSKCGQDNHFVRFCCTMYHVFWRRGGVFLRRLWSRGSLAGESFSWRHYYSRQVHWHSAVERLLHHHFNQFWRMSPVSLLQQSHKAVE